LKKETGLFVLSSIAVYHRSDAHTEMIANRTPLRLFCTLVDSARAQACVF